MTVFSDNLSVFRLTIIWLQGTFGDRAGTSGGCARGFGQSNSCASKRSANQVLTYAARAAEKQLNKYSGTSGGRARRARRARGLASKIVAELAYCTVVPIQFLHLSACLQAVVCLGTSGFVASEGNVERRKNLRHASPVKQAAPFTNKK